ncbi:MAG: hypothetical protein QM648_04705 [Solirubrobacterales bacterium]
MPHAWELNATYVGVDHAGRTIIAGNRGSSHRSLIFRLTKSGAPDTSFGQGGRFLLPAGFNTSGVATLPTGGLVLLENSSESTRLVVLTRRGETEKMSVLGGEGVLGIRACAIARQGSKVLVSGAFGESTTSVTVMRLALDGTMDATFGDGGWALLGPSQASSVCSSGLGSSSALAINRTGEIYVGLDSSGDIPPSPGSFQQAVAKLTSDGHLVRSYGDHGFAPLTISGSYNRGITSIAAAPDGSAVVSSSVGFAEPKSPVGQKLSFLTPAGAVDPASPARASTFAQVTALRNSRFVTSGASFKAFTTAFAEATGFADSGNLFSGSNDCQEWGAIARSASSEVVSISRDRNYCYSGGGFPQYVVRLLGPNGGRVAPRVRVTSDTQYIYYRKGKRKRLFRGVRGEAAPAARLKWVGVAIQRVNEKLQSTRSRCVWVTREGRGTIQAAFDRGVCTRPHFMHAHGRASWRLDLVRSLPAGHYRLWVRAETKAGAHNPFSSSDWDTYREFTIKQY